MCFVKTDDMSWPHIITGLPTGGVLSEVERRSRLAPTILSRDEVLHFRNEIVPRGQCALHMALQRGSPLEVVQVLVESDPSTLQLADLDGDLPLMTGRF
jgi:hypothetical protein